MILSTQDCVPAEIIEVDDQCLDVIWKSNIISKEETTLYFLFIAQQASEKTEPTPFGLLYKVKSIKKLFIVQIESKTSQCFIDFPVHNSVAYQAVFLLFIYTKVQHSYVWLPYFLQRMIILCVESPILITVPCINLCLTNIYWENDKLMEKITWWKS